MYFMILSQTLVIHDILAPTYLSYILASTHLSRENLALTTICPAVALKIEKEFYFIPGALSNMIPAKYG